MSSQVRRIVLEQPSRPGADSGRSLPRWVGPASWLVAPLFLTAVIGGLVLLRRGPDGLFTTVLVGVAAVPVLWGLISMLFPAYPDRRCMECGELGLVPLSEVELHGVRCTECGHVDETVGTWKFAEERDAPLEPLVIASRKRLARRPQEQDPAS